MSDLRSALLSRRALLGAAGVGSLSVVTTRLVAPQPAAAQVSAAAANPTRRVALAGTDGWVSMPLGSPPDLPFYPDPLAPAPFDTYVFGFRDVTGMTSDQVAAQRGKAQISAPILIFDEETDITVSLTNLGLQTRPDLFDGHTLHWHGFVNAIPLFDGVPELSLAVPIGRSLDYFYRPHDAGTYMYHCHFEDVEHVQMGMTGVVYVRPKQNKAPVGGDPLGTRYAYNDGNGSTRYHREYSMMITELWSAAHYRDAHIQVNDWTDFDASFWLLNGRGYPDTVAGNGDVLSTASGRLQYQPYTSHVRANAGETVLLRLANLGFQEHSLTCDNLDLVIVGKDANLLRGRDGTTAYVTTNTVDIAPGESRDVLIHCDQVGEFLLYDRHYSYLNNGGGAGYGGMLTTITVAAPGTYPSQDPDIPNA